MVLEEQNRLESLRREVEEITRQILRLVSHRTKLAGEIGGLKATLNRPVEDSVYEAVVRQRVLEECKRLGIDQGFAMRLLNLMILESIKQQTSLKRQSSAKVMARVVHRARELDRKGWRVIRLDIGDPDFGAPQRVRRALSKAAASGRAHYTDPRGIPELRDAMARSVHEQNGVEITGRNVLVTVGARLGIYLAMQSILEPGDEVIILYPAFSAYKQCAEACGARAITLEASIEQSWDPRLKQLVELITPATKMMVINNPNNPTGKILDRHDLQRLLAIAEERRITILSDEVYSAYSFSEFHSLLEFDELNHMYVSSLSKSHGMTGYRIGCVISDEEKIEEMARLQSLIVTSVPEFVQVATVEALECKEDVQRNVRRIQKRMKAAVEALQKLPVRLVPPQAGLYLFPKFSIRGFDGEKFAQELLEKKRVAVAPGSSYGNYPDFLRLAICRPASEITEAIGRIGELLA